MLFKYCFSTLSAKLFVFWDSKARSKIIPNTKAYIKDNYTKSDIVVSIYENYYFFNLDNINSISFPASTSKSGAIPTFSQDVSVPGIVGAPVEIDINKE